MNCDVATHSMWTVNERSKSRFRINDIKFSDLFKGDPPCFETTYGRGQFSRNSLNNSRLNKSTTSTQNSPSKQKNQSNNSLNKSNNVKASTSSSNNNKKKKKSNNKNLAQILNKKICDMTLEEFTIWRSHKTDDDLQDLEHIEQEADKLNKKEERDKEKEKQKQEKNKQKEYLKELKKPKEDFECENLSELPKSTPIQSKISQEMFGDAIIILEFLNYFGDLFELKDDFPTGFNFELLENALFSKSCDSALCNLLLFFLDSVFKCYNEETFDVDANGQDGDADSVSELEMDLSDDEEITLEQLYKEPIRKINDRESFSSLAENYSKLVKSIQGRSFKNIGLDVYTISEMLRLYFLTSGSSHNLKNKFWYQQRGGYTRMDELGIDFSLNEKHILKNLETMNVYELDPEDKLKILSNLCHQLMSHVRFRDLLEDNWQKITVLKAQLRDLQTEENRRLREETSERWKKKLQDRAKEKSRLEEIKSNIQTTKSPNKTAENAKSLEEIETAKALQYSNKKRDEFIKKEKHIQDEINQLQAKCCMQSLGKDRYHRRYWVLKSMPGIYIEDDHDYEQLNSILNSNNNTNDSPTTSIIIKSESQQQIIENMNGKENKPHINGNHSLTTTTTTKYLNGCDTKKLDECSMDISYSKNQPTWSFYCTSNQIEILFENLNERGIRESELKQNLTDLKDKIFESLNKTTIIKSLTLSKEEIYAGIQNSLRENINNVLTNIFNHSNNSSTQKIKRGALKLVNSALLSTNTFATSSSNEYLEMNLRGKLLDFEEQVFAGALGHLKVNDRLKWKEALDELNSYDPQCTTLTWGGDCTKPANELTIDLKYFTIKYLNENNSEESLEKTLKTVNNLAKALLQIEQAVEKRFLRTPLGDSQKTPEKQRRKPIKQQQHNGNGLDSNHNENSNDSNSSANNTRYQILHNWEKSLMNCTTLSQLFIHLQSLDESVSWSKSALNAKCKLCKRKCDAEKMLLCDKCDRGHHIYCLRPPLKEIPKDEWFCPDCLPKSEKTPRKIRKYVEEEEQQDDEEVDEEQEEDEVQEEEDEEEENEESTDDSNMAKNSKLRSTRNSKKKEETDEEESSQEEEQSDDDEEEENNENGEEDDTNNNDDDDLYDNENNDEEYVAASDKNKNKIKINGNHFKKKRKESSDDEEINVDDSSDESKRSGRKRKLTNPIKETKATSKVFVTLSGRNSRTRLTNYNELSEDVSGTDEDTKTNNKRVKTTQSKSAAMTNDTSSRNTELAHRLKVIEKLLNDMMKHQDGWPFLKPVSRREVKFTLFIYLFDFNK